MVQDTQLINKSRQDLSNFDEIWLFGYGSLIYKVDFPFIAAMPAHIVGWQRRFWQGSHDHRGTPNSPGRVLTLIAAPNERCFGIAYRVTEDVFEHLDHREKNGYLRFTVDLRMDTGVKKQGLVYIGMPDNTAFLGPASDQSIASQIYKSRGPSGENKDYVYRLADVLRDHGEHDSHVMAIEAELIRLAVKESFD